MATNPLAEVFGASPVKPIQQHMESVHACVMLLPMLVNAAQKGDWKRAEQKRKAIVKLEGDADKLKLALRTHVPKRLFMPVSRVDLIELIAAQDAIANCAKDIAGLIMVRKIQFPRGLAKPYKAMVVASLDAASRTLSAVQELDEVFEVGFGSRGINRVATMIKQIGKQEKRVDKLEVELQAELFKIEQDLPPVEVMFLYKLIELVGNLADCSEHAGNRLQILITS